MEVSSLALRDARLVPRVVVFTKDRHFECHEPGRNQGRRRRRGSIFIRQPFYYYSGGELAYRVRRLSLQPSLAVPTVAEPGLGGEPGSTPLDSQSCQFNKGTSRSQIRVSESKPETCSRTHNLSEIVQPLKKQRFKRAVGEYWCSSFCPSYW